MLRTVKKRKCSKFVEEFYANRAERKGVEMLEKCQKRFIEMARAAFSACFL